MPKIEKTPDGKVHVELENGPEKWDANDPMEATNQLAKALDEGKKWGKEGWEKAKQYEAELAQLKQPKPPATATPDPQEAQLQSYLVDQWARGLGFKDGAEAKQKLGTVLQTTDEVHNQVVASNFLSACPDFPNTAEAIEKLSQKIDAVGWDFSPQSMIAAHTLCIKENAYKPLTAEEQNAQWTAGLSAANRGQAPPQAPPGVAADNRGAPGGSDPWQMKLDELRKAALDSQQAGGR